MWKKYIKVYKYVSANVFKRISSGIVAEALHLNPVYLERIFKEEEGITISQYIRREKMERARNLLMYSDRSVGEISEYLGFSSQSKFGEVFRKECGMTPKQFRLQNKVSGF